MQVVTQIFCAVYTSAPNQHRIRIATMKRIEEFRTELRVALPVNFSFYQKKVHQKYRIEGKKRDLASRSNIFVQINGAFPNHLPSARTGRGRSRREHIAGAGIPLQSHTRTTCDSIRVGGTVERITLQ